MTQPDQLTLFPDKASALAAFEEARPDWLSLARVCARRLCLRYGTATIDDVRAACPPPDDIDPRIMGAVFHTADFKAVGFINSTRRTCHKRPIRVFALAIA